MPPKKSAKRPSVPLGPTAAEVEALIKEKLSGIEANIRVEQQTVDTFNKRHAFLRRDILDYGDQASAHQHSLRTEEDQALQESLDRSKDLHNSNRLKVQLESGFGKADSEVMSLYDDIDGLKAEIQASVEAASAEERAAVDDESLTSDQKLRKQGHSLFRQLEFLKCQLAGLRTSEVEVEAASRELERRLKFSEGWNEESYNGGRKELYPAISRAAATTTDHRRHIFDEDPGRMKTILAALPRCDFFHQEHHFFVHAQRLSELVNGHPLYPYHPYVAPRHRVAIFISSTAPDFSGLQQTHRPFLRAPATFKLLRDELLHGFDFRVEHVLLGRSRAPHLQDITTSSLSPAPVTTTATSVEMGGLGAQLLSEEKRHHRQHLCEIEVIPDSWELGKTSTSAAARRLAMVGTGAGAISPSEETEDAVAGGMESVTVPCETHRRFRAHSKEWLSNYLRKSLSSAGACTSGTESVVLIIKGYSTENEPSEDSPLIVLFPEDSEGSPSHRLIVTPSAIVDCLTATTDRLSESTLLILDIDSSCGSGARKGFVFVVASSGGGALSTFFCWKEDNNSKKEGISSECDLPRALLMYLTSIRKEQQMDTAKTSGPSTGIDFINYLQTVVPSSGQQQQPPSWVTNLGGATPPPPAAQTKNSNQIHHFLLPTPSAYPLVSTDTAPPLQLTLAFASHNNGENSVLGNSDSQSETIQRQLKNQLQLQPDGKIEVHPFSHIKSEREYRPALMTKILEFANQQDEHEDNNNKNSVLGMSSIHVGKTNNDQDDATQLVTTTTTVFDNPHVAEKNYVSVIRNRAAASSNATINNNSSLIVQSTVADASDTTTGTPPPLSLLLLITVPPGIQLSTLVQELQTELYYARVTRRQFTTPVSISVVSSGVEPNGTTLQALLSIVASPVDPAEKWALKAITAQRAAESQHFSQKQQGATATKSSPFVNKKRKLLINSHLTLMSSYQYMGDNTTTALGANTASDVGRSSFVSSQAVGDSSMIGNTKLISTLPDGGGSPSNEADTIRQLCVDFATDLSSANGVDQTTPSPAAVLDIQLYSVFIEGLSIAALHTTLLPATEGPPGHPFWNSLKNNNNGDGTKLSTYILSTINFDFPMTNNNSALAPSGVLSLRQMVYGGERSIRRLLSPLHPARVRHQVIALFVSPQVPQKPGLPSQHFEQQCHWMAAIGNTDAEEMRPLGGFLRGHSIVGCRVDSQDLSSPTATKSDDNAEPKRKLWKTLCDVAPTPVVDYISSQANDNHSLLFLFAPRQSERLRDHQSPSPGTTTAAPPRPLLIYGNTPSHRIHHHTQIPVFDACEIRQALSFYLTDLCYPSTVGISSSISPPRDNWVLI